MYYIEYTHPLTFDGIASYTRGLCLFETGRYYIGIFHWTMFDRDHTKREKFFIARKEDGMPRKG